MAETVDTPVELSPLERAARALVDAPMVGPNRPDQTLRSLIGPSKPNGFTDEQIDLIGATLAGAVLTAIREPSEAMVDSGIEAFWPGDEAAYPDEHGGCEPAINAAWQAMINAALAEEG